MTAQSPPSAGTPLSRRALYVVIAVTLALAAALHWRPVQLNGDFTTSYLTWQGWRHGQPFHSTTSIDPADLALDQHRFLTWWSPGTYLAPAMLESTGLTLGAAIAVWLALAGSAGFIGWYRLLLRFGFSDRATALTLLLILLSWHTLYPFRIYHGGEATLFAIFPWCVLAVLASTPGSWFNLPVIAAIAFAGTMVKLSFLIPALGLTVFLAWRGLEDKPSAATAIRRLLPAGLGFGLGAALIYVLILSKGGNPGTAGLTPADEQFNPPAAIATALVLPFKALFALTSMTPRLDQVFGWPEARALTGWLLVCLGLAGPVYWLAWRHAPGAAYRQALLTVGGLTVASLAWLYFRHAAVSGEDRHARLVALLLLPGLVTAVLQTGRAARAALGLMLVAGAGWGGLSLAHHWNGGTRHGATGSRGITYWDLQADDVRAVAAVDRTLAGAPALWLTTIEEVSLELPDRRVRAFQPVLDAAREHRAVRGQAGHILILTAAGPEADAAAAALPALTGSRAPWQRFSTGHQVLFYQGSAMLPLSPSP